MALEKVDGVATALVNRDIMLVFNEERPLDQAAFGKVLQPFKMTIKSVEKAAKLPF